MRAELFPKQPKQVGVINVEFTKSRLCKFTIQDCLVSHTHRTDYQCLVLHPSTYFQEATLENS